MVGESSNVELYNYKNNNIKQINTEKDSSCVCITGRFNLNEAVGVKTVIFGDDFNLPIGCDCDGMCECVSTFPPNTEYIKFGKNFNQNICKLSKLEKLETLVLGENYTLPITQLPSSLKVISVGKNYNHPLDNLPNIEILILGISFDMPLDMLPNSLKTLMIKNPKYSHDLMNIPVSVSEIAIRRSMNIARPEGSTLFFIQ